MSYKSKPEARKQATQQELTKLELFRLLKRVYRSLGGKRDLRQTGQKRQFYSLRKSHMAWIKVKIIQFQPWNYILISGIN